MQSLLIAVLVLSASAVDLLHAEDAERCHIVLTMEAIKLGADAVFGIDLDYNDFGTSGKMLAVIATGTAVKMSELFP